MPGIIPTLAQGAITVRGTDGVCLAPAGVSNDYCPPAIFTSSCAILYLPDDCTARITAAQINGFQSEMMCLAATMNPDGNWNCGSVCNLSASFTGYVTETGPSTLWRQVQTHLCSMAPIAGAAYAALANESMIVCDGLGNIRRLTTLSLAQAICATPAAIAAVQGCLTPYPIVAPGANILVTPTVGVQGQITYTVSTNGQLIASALCASPAALTQLQGCLVPYPLVAAGANATIVPTVNPMTGRITYTVSTPNDTLPTLINPGAGIDVSAIISPSNQLTYTVSSECPNPIIDISCETPTFAGDMVVTKCDGSQTRFSVRYATVNLSIPPFIFECTPDTPVNATSAVFSANMQNEACAGNPVMITLQGGFLIGNNTSTGSISFVVQVSLNGGPWSTISTGGNIGITAEQPSGTEFNVSGVSYVTPVPGMNTYDFRIQVTGNALGAGSLVVNSGFNIQIARHTFSCC